MAPSTTNYTEIQHDEIEALRSIYMEDFVEEKAKTGAWNKTIERTFKLKLRAANGDGQAGLTLIVSLPPTYPKSLPRLTLDYGSEIRQTSKTQAQEVLRNKPKSLIGSEMIFEIATSLQDILDNTWVDPLETVPLDEERAVREKAAQVKAQRDAEGQRQAELHAQQEEETLLHELVTQKGSTTAKRATKSPQPAKIYGSLPLGAMMFERPSCNIRTPYGITVAVDIIHNKLLNRKGPVCDIFTVQHTDDNPEAKAHSNDDYPSSQPFLVLKECSVPLISENEPTIKRLVQNLESKLEFHMGLNTHESVIKPLNYRIQRSLDERSLVTGWTVSILMERAVRHSLQETLDIVDKLDGKLLRAWSIQLLGGLQFYHRHGVAHGNLHLGNILLQRDREAERGNRKITIAMLSDGGYQRDLHLLKSGYSPDYFSISWTAPENLNVKSTEDCTPASDVWDFGRCFLQMAFGIGILHEYPSGPTSVIDELNLTESLKALLSQMFHTNPKKRSSTWDLLHFEFFRNEDALREASHHEGPTSMEDSTLSLPALHQTRSHRESVPRSAGSSRYSKDFVEDGRLGKGGFGEVFRVRNKVDGQPYAVKKVKARSRAALDPVLSEVTVLSRLSHPNVVRYFASWIEDGITMDNVDESDSSEYEYSSSRAEIGSTSLLPASSRGLDFISSTNTQVIFAGNGSDEGNSTGEDEDESSDESQENEEIRSLRVQDFDDAQDPSLAIERGSGFAKEQMTWTMLYIQMEYCKQETLRDLINSGLQKNDTEIWRLFRQIVHGLAHIHGLSIVHRDLKPENIFIDSSGDVRIGDFGLARPGDYRTTVRVAPANKTTAREIFGSFTKDIGTASYVAPEVRSAGNGKYNEKADMFSLGVVLLEMNVAFPTGMERAENLENLQKENHTLPSALSVPEKKVQAKIFTSLVQNKPSQRPSSSELLESGEIPIQAENESVRMARRLLNDHASHYRSQFIGSLFATEIPISKIDTVKTSSDLMQAMTLLDDVRAMSRSAPSDLELQAVVKNKLTNIFKRHGAVERTDSPTAFPYHSEYPSSDIVKLLNPSGKVLQLPYDLILPNALLLAKQLRPERKTFVFDNVYRVDPLREQPKIFGETNFDIVSGNTDDLALREAEVLKVIDEILDVFPNLSSIQMCYHINHSELLDSILQFCDIASFKWPAVKETMSKLHTGEWTWIKVRHELRGPSIAVAATSLDELEQFDFRDTWEKSVPRLRSILKETCHLETTFAHLERVIAHLARFNVKRKVYISPLSSYNEKFYHGHLLFQCLYDQRKRSVLAAGGRYDQLIRNYQTTGSRRSHVHAVGCQLAWTGLCTDLTNYFKKIRNARVKRKSQRMIDSSWHTRRCDVLVKSFDQNLLNSVGCEILQVLWLSDISAELEENEKEHNNDKLYLKNQDRSEEYSWIILIKSEHLLKVRNTSRDDETDIALSELAEHIRSEVRQRDRQEERSIKAPLLRHSSQLDSHASTKDSEVDVKVFMSLTMGKKVNRKTIIEEAKHHRQVYLQTCSDSPILAMETKDDAFEGIRETRLSEPESWKNLIHHAPPGERKYLGQLQDMLKDMAKETTQKGNNNVIIYNFRTKACILYNLAKTAP